jgi:hypothetical protein
MKTIRHQQTPTLPPPLPNYAVNKTRRGFKFGMWLLGIFGAFIALLMLAILTSKIDRNAPATLRAGDLDLIPVATSEQALSDFTAYANAYDPAGSERMVLSRRVFRVPAGTHVTVLDAGFTSSRISIRDGQHAGEIAYTYPEWIER